jgi:hypothetical protein
LPGTPLGTPAALVEGLNSLIKKVERIAAGFRSFVNYRLRILLVCGGCNWDLLGAGGKSGGRLPSPRVSPAFGCRQIPMP